MCFPLYSPLSETKPLPLWTASVCVSAPGLSSSSRSVRRRWEVWQTVTSSDTVIQTVLLKSLVPASSVSSELSSFSVFSKRFCPNCFTSFSHYSAMFLSCYRRCQLILSVYCVSALGRSVFVTQILHPPYTRFSESVFVHVVLHHKNEPRGLYVYFFTHTTFTRKSKELACVWNSQIK